MVMDMSKFEIQLLVDIREANPTCALDYVYY